MRLSVLMNAINTSRNILLEDGKGQYCTSWNKDSLEEMFETAEEYKPSTVETGGFIFKQVDNHVEITMSPIRVKV